VATVHWMDVGIRPANSYHMCAKKEQVGAIATISRHRYKTMPAIEVTSVRWATSTEASRRAVLARAIGELAAAHDKMKDDPPEISRRVVGQQGRLQDED